jgi:hypothetical protein
MRRERQKGVYAQFSLRPNFGKKFILWKDAIKFVTGKEFGDPAQEVADVG